MYKTIAMTIDCTDSKCGKCENLRTSASWGRFWCNIFGNMLDDTRGEAKRSLVCLRLFEKAE